MNREDLDQCESCEGLFDPEKMTRNTEDQSFCNNCWEGITNEIRNEGIKHLDEYLESRNLIADFNVFANAKWSGITEEEYEELYPD